MRTRNAYIWGMILILFGFFFLVHNFTRIDIWGFVWTWWPMILVFIGVDKVISHFRQREERE